MAAMMPWPAGTRHLPQRAWRLSLAALGGAELWRGARFACVGAFGCTLNTLVLWLLTEQLGLHYLAASVVATEAAILSNFLLNSRWTFSGASARGTPLGRLLRFQAISVAGIGLTLASLFCLTTWGSVPLLAANVAAVFPTAAWNYAANRRWTWAATA